MKRLLVIIPLAALAALLAANALRGLAAPSYDPVAVERQSLAIARARQLAPVETLVAAAWSIVPLLMALLLIALFAAWGVAALARFRFYARPDARGLLPVELPSLASTAPAALGAYHRAALTRAGVQPVPHTYSPHTTYSAHADYRGDGSRDAAPALIESLPSLNLATVPSFAQLLDRGRIGRGNPLLLGYDADGQPVEGSWLQLYSCAIGGLSGSGKSWTATFLAAQAALFGSRIVLLDPHAADPQSLAQRLAPMGSRFVCAVASEPAEMRRTVALVASELARRKAGGRGEPWLFIADEFSALQRGELAEPLAALVEALGQEGRKLGLYAMVCGQIWSAARAGGTELRDSLASSYMHRLRPAQARMLTGLATADLPSDLIELPAGAAYLLDTAGELRKVSIPQMTPADVQRVAGLLSDGAADRVELPGFHQASGGRVITPPADAWRKPDGSQMEAYDEQATSVAGRAARPSADAQRAAALFLAGKDLAAVVFELRGVKSSEGRRYQAAATEVQALLRAALGAA